MTGFKFFLLTKSAGLYINLLSVFSPDRAKALSYSLFSRPRYGKLKLSAVPDILKSAETETISVEGDTMQTYLWPGSGPTVLLVHGWESNTARWELLLPHLSGRCTIVAIDAPDHGLSGGRFSIPKYAGFIDAAARRFAPDFIIGHSIGGAASIFYQHKYQNEKIQKMVLLGSPADFNTITGNYVKLLSLSKRSNDLFHSHFTEHFHYHPDDFTARNFARTVSVPGLVAHDTEDDIVHFREGKKIAESWETAEFIETSGLGHSMHDEVLYGRISRFLFDNLRMS